MSQRLEISERAQHAGTLTGHQSRTSLLAVGLSAALSNARLFRSAQRRHRQLRNGYHRVLDVSAGLKGCSGR